MAKMNDQPSMAANGGMRTSARPISAPRSLRPYELRGLTSLPAGRVVPIAAMPLLREDAIKTGRFRMSFEMHETAEMLANPVNVKVSAHLVPNLALERFDGMDALNRSYQGVAVEGNTVVPFIETATWPAYASISDIHKYLGLHMGAGTDYNTMYTEAYNAIWNFRAANRSPNITKRARLEGTLAPAFWNHSRFANIVPNFDQALIDGEVALNVTDAQLPVKGIGTQDSEQFETENNIEVTGETSDIDGSKWSGDVWVQQDAARIGWPKIYAEMQANGITVSLSNIDAAKKTAAFARLRQQYEGVSEDYLIDLMMNAISIPEQAFRQPILLGQRSVDFGMSLRYSSTAGSLDESAVNGATFIDMPIRLPRLSVGGVVMLTAEILPEQLFEREEDPFLSATAVADFPEYLRDTLDPEKVEIVENKYIDMDHATPDDTFGYAPLNHKWRMQAPRIGGRFFRPDSSATFSEDRQRIWAVEQEDPTLSEDFFISTNINQDVFSDTNSDPFEVVTQGAALIEGNTVFGGRLAESTDDYETIEAEIPTDRIDQT